MKKIERFILVLLLIAPIIAAAQSVDTMFTRLFNASGNFEDRLSDMAVSPQGIVYMTGFGHSSNNTDDYWTIACDRWGSKLWEAYYAGAGDWNDSAAALTLDSRGDLYVTGQSFETPNESASITTIKYRSDSTRLWISRLHFPSDIDDGGLDIVAQDSTVLYVCGYRHVAGLDNNYVVVKYNALTGDTMWTRSYSRSGEEDDDMPTAIAVDRNGNVVVTGYSYSGNTDYDYDYCTIKYDANGAQLWRRTYNNLAHATNGEDYAWALAVDGSNNVIVTGMSYDDNTDFDYVTVKYGTNGDTIWTARYNRAPGNYEDMAWGVVTDGFNNVYVTGASYDSTQDYDFCTIRYNPSSSSPAWIRRYDRNGYDDEAFGIAQDSAGNIYATGWSCSPDHDNDVVTTKMSSSTGVEAWNHVYNSPSDNEDDGQKVACGPSNMIFVGAQVFTDSHDFDYGLLRLYEQTHDCGVVAILAPADTILAGDSTTPKVLIHNFGIYPETVSVRIAISPSYRDSARRFIDAGNYETLSFRSYVELLAGTYAARCTTLLLSDVNPLNDLAQDSFVVTSPTGISETGRNNVVIRPYLQIAPNPARSLASISYAVSDPEQLTLKIYNAAGRLVKNLARAGPQRVGVLNLDLHELAAGIYIVKLDTPKHRFTRKLVIER
jgi:hypothetical protein